MTDARAWRPGGWWDSDPWVSWFSAFRGKNGCREIVRSWPSQSLSCSRNCLLQVFINCGCPLLPELNTKMSLPVSELNFLALLSLHLSSWCVSWSLSPFVREQVSGSGCPDISHLRFPLSSGSEGYLDPLHLISTISGNPWKTALSCWFPANSDPFETLLSSSKNLNIYIASPSAGGHRQLAKEHPSAHTTWCHPQNPLGPDPKECWY